MAETFPPSFRPTSSEEPEPTHPFPPRYWWLARITTAVLLLGFALSLTWFGWDRAAQRRLAVDLAPLIAAGEPVNAVGMNPPPIPEPENGASLYRKAFLALDRTVPSPANSSIDYDGWPPFPPRWHKLADRAIPMNGATLALMRQARDYRRFDWGIRAASPAYSVLLPHLNNARELANFTADAALYAHVHGDDAAAVEFIRDARKESASLNVQPAFIVTDLVAVGCEALALVRLEVIAPGLTIAPEEGGPVTVPPSPPTYRPEVRPATRAQVRALIGELLEERGSADGLHQAYVGERAAQLDMVEWMGRNVPVVRPMFQLDARRVARANSAMLRVATQPTMPAAKDAMASDPALQVAPSQTNIPSYFIGPAAGKGLAAKRSPVDYTRLLSTDVCRSFGAGNGRAIGSDMQVRAECALAAASLAVRLYCLDHGGQFPPSLEALVPNYLPRLPVDPFTADGKPIRYVIARGALPGGGDRPLVYSVGGDGVDDTAASGLTSLPKTPCFGVNKTLDQWRDVSRWEPVKTPEDLKMDAEQEAEAARAATQPAK